MRRLKRQPLNDLALQGVLEVELRDFPSLALGSLAHARADSDQEATSMARADTVAKLNVESIRGWLTSRRGWKRRANRLTKVFEFDSFRGAIVFVNRVATLADSHDHHPDIDVRYNRVTVTLSTHEAGGITEKDLDLAEQIDFATSAD